MKSLDNILWDAFCAGICIGEDEPIRNIGKEAEDLSETIQSEAAAGSEEDQEVIRHFQQYRDSLPNRAGSVFSMDHEPEKDAVRVTSVSWAEAYRTGFMGDATTAVVFPFNFIIPTLLRQRLEHYHTISPKTGRETCQKNRFDYPEDCPNQTSKEK